MDDWISQLQPGQRVLDLGSGTGSFAMAVALDEDPDAFRLNPPAPAGQAGPYCRVLGVCGALPFTGHSFDLVICHHSLEHFSDVDAVLQEIARILKPAGRLFVSVPDGYSLCDGIYRWLFEGGGHVNRFHRKPLVSRIERTVGLRLVRWGRLYSSFGYLRNLAELLRDPPSGLATRLVRLGKRPLSRIKRAQVLLYYATLWSDRMLGTKLALYGWGFYFDRSGALRVEQPGFWNVCLYCGDGQPVTDAQMHPPGLFLCKNCSRLTPYQLPPPGAV